MDRAEEGSGFRVESTWPADGVALVAVGGDVGFSTAAQFRDVLSERFNRGARHLVVDLTSAAFIDSTTLGVLVACARLAHGGGGSLLVVCDDERICHVLEIAGLAARFAVHATPGQALAAAGVRPWTRARPGNGVRRQGRGNKGAGMPGIGRGGLLQKLRS